MHITSTFRACGILNIKRYSSHLRSQDKGLVNWISSSSACIGIPSHRVVPSGGLAHFQRGIGYDHEEKVKIQHPDTRVGDDGQLHILIETTKTTHIKSGILYNRLKDVGKIEQYEKKIRLNSDSKRFWLNELSSLMKGDSAYYSIRGK